MVSIGAYWGRVFMLLRGVIGGIEQKIHVLVVGGIEVLSES